LGGFGNSGLRTLRNGGARGQNFDAAELSARALWTMIIDGDVATLGRASRSPVIDAFVEDNA